MAELKPGDVVVMKSGGPAMVVGKVEDGKHRRVQCEWMKDGERRDGFFYEASLQVVDEAEGDRVARLRKALSGLGG